MRGSDVSEATVTGTLLVRRDQPPVWAMGVPKTRTGIRQLIARSAPEEPWVVEPMGRDSQPLVVQARAAGRHVLRAQPKRAQDFLASVSPRATPDRLDRDGVARDGLAAAVPPAPSKRAAMDARDQWRAARR